MFPRFSGASNYVVPGRRRMVTVLSALPPRVGLVAMRVSTVSRYRAAHTVLHGRTHRRKASVDQLVVPRSKRDVALGWLCGRSFRGVEGVGGVEGVTMRRGFTTVDINGLGRLGRCRLRLNPSIGVPKGMFYDATLKAAKDRFSFRSFTPNARAKFLRDRGDRRRLCFFLSNGNRFRMSKAIFPIRRNDIIEMSPTKGQDIHGGKAAPLLVLYVRCYDGAFSRRSTASKVVLGRPMG